MALHYTNAKWWPSAPDWVKCLLRGEDAPIPDEEYECKAIGWIAFFAKRAKHHVEASDDGLICLSYDYPGAHLCPRCQSDRARNRRVGDGRHRLHDALLCDDCAELRNERSYALECALRTGRSPLPPLPYRATDMQRLVIYAKALRRAGKIVCRPIPVNNDWEWVSYRTQLYRERNGRGIRREGWWRWDGKAMHTIDDENIDNTPRWPDQIRSALQPLGQCHHCARLRANSRWYVRTKVTKHGDPLCCCSKKCRDALRAQLAADREAEKRFYQQAKMANSIRRLIDAHNRRKDRPVNTSAASKGTQRVSVACNVFARGRR